MTYVAASYNVIAMYPFVPLNQYRVQKIMIMYDCFPFFKTHFVAKETDNHLRKPPISKQGQVGTYGAMCG